MSGIVVEQAQKGIVAGIARARAIGSPSSGAIIHPGRNLLGDWALSETARRRILVGNPATLYGFY
jgi:hypothetical protein